MHLMRQNSLTQTQSGMQQQILPQCAQLRLQAGSPYQLQSGQQSSLQGLRCMITLQRVQR
jgi:hypothetical protein